MFEFSEDEVSTLLSAFLAGVSWVLLREYVTLTFFLLDPGPKDDERGGV